MDSSHVSMKAELDPVALVHVQRLLRPIFAKTPVRRDLRQRLSFFGYDVQDEFLVTAPQGKRVCPISAI